jgi:hypothetical protein
MWIIEKEIKKGDYLYAKVKNHPNATKNGYVLYHRIAVENHLGRLLLSTEVVHHKDKNRFNNNIENLELLTKDEHNLLHGKEKQKPLIIAVCSQCSKNFSLPQNQYNARRKESKNLFCSRSCNGKFYAHSETSGLRKRISEHGINLYRYGCRCDICRKANREKQQKYKDKKRCELGVQQ